MALVGCGRIAERGWVPALRRVAEAQLVAVADPVQSRCAALAPGVAAYRGAALLAAETTVDLAVVATPAALHLQDARSFAERGIAVLVEKPPAETLHDAEALARLEPQPWIGFNRRFVPEVAALRDALGAASGPFALELELTTVPRSWGAYAAADGPLHDLGVHLVDLACWLTESRVQRVRAVGPVGESSAFLLETGNGSARVSVSHRRGWRELVRVRDGGGRTVGSYRAGGPAARVRGRVRPSRESPLVSSLAAQLRAALAVLAGREGPAPASAGDGLHVMAALAAVERSAGAGGEWVDVPTVGFP